MARGVYPSSITRMRINERRKSEGQSIIISNISGLRNADRQQGGLALLTLDNLVMFITCVRSGIPPPDARLEVHGLTSRTHAIGKEGAQATTRSKAQGRARRLVAPHRPSHPQRAAGIPETLSLTSAKKQTISWIDAKASARRHPANLMLIASEGELWGSQPHAVRPLSDLSSQNQCFGEGSPSADGLARNLYRGAHENDPCIVFGVFVRFRAYGV